MNTEWIYIAWLFVFMGSAGGIAGPGISGKRHVIASIQNHYVFMSELPERVVSLDEKTTFYDFQLEGYSLNIMRIETNTIPCHVIGEGKKSCAVKEKDKITGYFLFTGNISFRAEFMGSALSDNDLIEKLENFSSAFMLSLPGQ